MLSASTETATAYHLGGRDLDSVAEFGILPAFAGIAVPDRYGNTSALAGTSWAGSRPAAAHVLRDFADTAQTYPDAHWLTQATRALGGLITAWHTARNASLPAIDADVRDEFALEFRRLCGSAWRRCPDSRGRDTPPRSVPGANCWSAAVTARPTSYG